MPTKTFSDIANQLTREETQPRPKMPRAFADLSIEQGIREFFDNDGQKYRAERDPFSAAAFTTWKVFKKSGNVSDFVCTVRARRDASPKTIFQALQNA